MLTLNERFIVDADGHPIEVVLPIASYRQLLARLDELGAASATATPLAEWRNDFREALARSGYTTREQIVQLTREIKRERADERERGA